MIIDLRTYSELYDWKLTLQYLRSMIRFEQFTAEQPYVTVLVPTRFFDDVYDLPHFVSVERANDFTRERYPDPDIMGFCERFMFRFV